MNRPEKISHETNYRKVYLSDLRNILNIYHDNRTDTPPEKHQFQVEKLTEQFGLPLAIAESNNELIGFAAARLNELEEIEFAAYYKNGVSQSEIQPFLEQQARTTFNSTFNNGPEAGKKLKQSSQRLVEWLNKCS
jgi:hypothetical protein